MKKNEKLNLKMKDLKKRFKSEAHSLINEKVNKITLSFNDDKRLQSFNKIRLYPCGISAGKICKIEL